MSKWDEHDLLPKVTAALRQDGRPYMTAYQLAIKLERAHPGLAENLGMPLGGAGIGSRNSLAQYLGSELARRSKRLGESFPVEHAYFSRYELREISFGTGVVSSVTDSGYDHSIFRWRGPVSDS
ncbi:hypothetical protein SK854_27865 [Lentzea sp. BCCO 10_0061]|jgi:hypothetical protein|uniref:Uncharacterized protein n=1 Tax=Lentzea sokolovensis TaxID=3095429 RepID=A0ABU4V2E1_9PSEU|nr:hypothetical protein [Lentzea sp. BCCO 10_0061]MDX8145956.1 hypothetical protein [Lentzea sp. BCCO 10_0061]